MDKLRVWHVPQIPMKCFYVPVASVEEGKKVMSILSAYDMFQFDNRIKPDYCNSCGLQIYNEDEKDWWDWDIETEDGDYFDDVDEYFEGNKEIEEFDNELFGQLKGR